MAKKDVTKAWRQNNPEKYRTGWKARNKERADRLKQEREIEIGLQPDQCQLCGNKLKDKRNEAHYDHNHGSGRGRGWLCNNCNVGLGCLADNPVFS